jgi:hypothetical protein
MSAAPTYRDPHTGRDIPTKHRDPAVHDGIPDGSQHLALTRLRSEIARLNEIVLGYAKRNRAIEGAARDLVAASDRLARLLEAPLPAEPSHAPVDAAGRIIDNRVAPGA